MAVALNLCSVIIVNFNAGDFLQAAVESVLMSAGVSDVCIIDNASTDNSLAFLSDARDSRLTTLRNARNLGFAAACNMGLARAKSDNVLVLNPDCRVQLNAIESLLAILRSADRVGMVGPLLLNPDGSEQLAGRRDFPLPGIVIRDSVAAMCASGFFARHDKRSSRRALPDKPQETQAISGACMMVRRDAMADVGTLDEGYFLHCEDLDWCMRFRLRGWTILFVPDAKVIHEKGVSSKGRPILMEYYKHKGIIRLYGKFLNGASRGKLGLLSIIIWIRFLFIAAWKLITNYPQRGDPLAP
jgi:GT2 family glycosyltransferase